MTRWGQQWKVVAFMTLMSEEGRLVARESKEEFVTSIRDALSDDVRAEFRQVSPWDEDSPMPTTPPWTF